MNSDELNLIIGGSIAIVSSVITGLISYFIQTNELNKKRKWDLEDRKKIQSKSVLWKRLDIIEDTLSNYLKLFHELYLHIPEKDGEFIVIDTAYDEITKIDDLIYFASLVNDTELSKVINDFDKLACNYINKIINGHSQDYGLLQLLPEQLKELRSSATLIGKRIDIIRINTSL